MVCLFALEPEKPCPGVESSMTPNFVRKIARGGGDSIFTHLPVGIRPLAINTRFIIQISTTPVKELGAGVDMEHAGGLVRRPWSVLPEPTRGHTANTLVLHLGVGRFS